jgi:glycosyltransferase involved in cell wall biosynthesis
VRLGLVTDFYHPWIGGPATVVRNLAQGLVSLGHEVSILAPSPGGNPDIEYEGSVKITRARSVSVPFGHNLRVAISPFRSAGAWLDQFRPDIVHIHHPFPLSASALWMARRRKIPVVATNHTMPECALWGLRGHRMTYRVTHDVLARWIVFLMQRCTCVATPTETAAAALCSLGFHRDVVTISNGVDTTKFCPGPESETLRSRLELDSRPIILYTGRLDAEKDMDIWFRAAAELAKTTDVQLVVGGEGSDRERLESLVGGLGIQNRTKFIGYLPADDFRNLYRLARVYFITSPVELQSISTLEAVASGLPVVGVRAGALPELVHNGENGYLMPEGDWEGAAKRVADIVTDDAMRLRFAARSRDVGVRHDMQKTIASYERFLLDNISRVRGATARERASVAGGS